MADDRELIQALRERLPGAWEAFCQRHLPVILQAVRRTLETYGRRGADADIEDVAFEFLTAILADDCRLLGMIRAPYDLQGWLAVSARRRAIDFLRRRSGAGVSLDALGEDPALRRDAEGRVVPAGDPGPGAANDTTEEVRDEVREAVEELGARERLAVQLFYLKGKSYREIAETLGMNINTVSPTLRHAVGKIQRRLQQRGLWSPTSS